MRSTTIWILAALVVIVGFVWWFLSNDQEEPVPTPSQVETKAPGDYFPATVGSTWTFAGHGNEYAAFTREVLYARGDKVQLQENNGGTISASVYQISDQAITRVFFQGEEYDEQDRLDAEPNESMVILKAPLQAGTTWETGAETRQIVRTDAEVETPAGKFTDCIEVEITGEYSQRREYFKEGVGLVKREFTSEGTQVISSLESYAIKE